MLLQTEVLFVKPEGIQLETLDCWLVGTGRTFRVTMRHIEQNWSTSSAWLRDRHQEIISLLHLFTPFCPLHASSFTNSYTPWLSCTQRPLHLPPLPSSLWGVLRLGPLLFLFSLPPPRLADVFEWCAADGECWAMTDGYDKQMVLLVVFNHRNSVGHEVRALSCQCNTKWRQIYPRHHRFWNRKCVGAYKERGLNPDWCLCGEVKIWYSFDECLLLFKHMARS